MPRIASFNASEKPSLKLPTRATALKTLGTFFGCSFTFSEHGNVIDEESYEKLPPGIRQVALSILSLTAPVTPPVEKPTSPATKKVGRPKKK